MSGLISANQNDPNIQTATTEVRSRIGQVNTVTNFYTEQQQSGKELVNAMLGKTNLFGGDPYKKSLFLNYMDLNNSLQSDMGNLIAAPQDDQTVRESKNYANGKLTANQYQMLHLAKGGRTEDLDFVSEQAEALVAYPRNVRNEYKSLNTSLENDMSTLVTANQSDPNIREATATVRNRIDNTRTAATFWDQQGLTGKRIMNNIVGTNAERFNNGTADSSSYVSLSNSFTSAQSDVGTLLSAGQTNISARQAMDNSSSALMSLILRPGSISVNQGETTSNASPLSRQYIQYLNEQSAESYQVINSAPEATANTTVSTDTNNSSSSTNTNSNNSSSTSSTTTTSTQPLTRQERIAARKATVAERRQERQAGHQARRANRA